MYILVGVTFYPFSKRPDVTGFEEVVVVMLIPRDLITGHNGIGLEIQ